MNPRYPIYIISKGRWDTRLTSKALEKMRVPYRIVIEPQEHFEYSSFIDSDKILQLPFRDLGQGSIPARNWVWEHALEEKHDRHWIMDDNMDGFARLYKNYRYPVESGSIFRAAEDFVDRYENVALAGFQYRFFTSPRSPTMRPYKLNTRIYSCILINNHIDFRWRGRYNEDTDLSIRALKAGWCTILFYAFLCNKTGTMIMKGGNTEDLYQGDGRLDMAQSLVDQHPDIVRITRKWGRWQHEVNYEPFKRNKLIKKSDLNIPEGINNYGMVLVDVI